MAAKSAIATGDKINKQHHHFGLCPLKTARQWVYNAKGFQFYGVAIPSSNSNSEQYARLERANH